MGSFSPVHMIILLVFALVFLIPIGQILRRAGFSPWLALLWCVPFVNIILLWVFAFAGWPRDRSSPTA